MPIINRQVVPNGPSVAPSAKSSLAKPATVGSVLSSMRSAWDVVDRIKMLVYGRSGSGKTSFLGTFSGKTLWLVCSGSKQPGEMRSIMTPEHKKRITPVIVDRSEQIAQLLPEMEAFELVVLDHISGLADLTIKEITGLAELPTVRSFGMATRDQWSQSNIQCIEICRALLGLSTNVAIISQERKFGEEESSDIIKPVIGPATSPGVCNWLTPAVDYTLQAFIRPKMETVKTKLGGKEIATQVRGKGVEYCLRTAPSETFMTKFRVPRGRVLPDVIVDPTWEKVMAVIRGQPQPK